jgi:hypothetical protein
MWQITAMMNYDDKNYFPASSRLRTTPEREKICVKGRASPLGR